DLDDTVAASAAGNFAEGRAVHRCRRRTEVGQVEDIGELTTDLKLNRFEYGEAAEERGVDVPITWVGELRGTRVSKKTQRSYTWATGSNARGAIGRRIKPFLLHCSTRTTVVENVGEMPRR